MDIVEEAKQFYGDWSEPELVVDCLRDAIYDAVRIRAELDKAEETIDSYSIQCVKNEARIAELEAVIEKTLENNGHLADGDNCTLFDLREVLTKEE